VTLISAVTSARFFVTVSDAQALATPVLTDTPVAGMNWVPDWL
jgi:hypothetical protein